MSSVGEKENMETKTNSSALKRIDDKISEIFNEIEEDLAFRNDDILSDPMIQKAIEDRTAVIDNRPTVSLGEAVAADLKENPDLPSTSIYSKLRFE